MGKQSKTEDCGCKGKKTKTFFQIFSEFVTEKGAMVLPRERIDQVMDSLGITEPDAYGTFDLKPNAIGLKSVTIFRDGVNLHIFELESLMEILDEYTHVVTTQQKG